MKKIGHVVILDPEKKYLVVMDKTQVRPEQAERLIRSLREMKGGDIFGLALDDLNSINFVEVDGEIELQTV